jgi:ATP-dependent Zn protease
MFSIFGMMWIMARMDLHRTILPESIKTRFSDVYGQDKAVERLSEVRGILDNPEEVEHRGGYMPGGVLLEGPPGTGKTLLAEAFAGETGKPFVSVGPESFTNMFVGVPVLKVKMLFRHLRKLSVKHGGVVIFFDEIDALGSRGGGVINQMLTKIVDKIVIQGGGSGSGALQMLLTEMSGIAKPKGFYNKIRVMLGFKPVPPPKYRILWIGATNLSGALDAALLRPGRFDRRIKVGFPDREGRAVTFQKYLDKVNHDLTSNQVDILARENPQATGASIKDAVNEGLLKVVREGRTVITWEDMRHAILWKSMGEEIGEADLKEDRRRVSLHEAAHAVASHHFRPEAPIQYASVIKRDKGTGGFVAAVDEVERYQLKDRLIADVMCALASVWSEKHFFDDNLSVGPGSDLQKATKTVTAMVARHAMGSTVMVWGVNEKVPERIEEEIQDTLQAYYEDLHDFMVSRRDQVELVAQLLAEHGTVDGVEIHELLARMEQE